MTGFIVGYFSEWSEERAAMIIGYFTDFDNAMSIAKKEQEENIAKHNGFRQVYVVEIEENRVYKMMDSTDWIKSFHHYLFQNGKIIELQALNKTDRMNGKITEGRLIEGRLIEGRLIESRIQEEEWTQVKKMPRAPRKRLVK